MHGCKPKKNEVIKTRETPSPKPATESQSLLAKCKSEQPSAKKELKVEDGVANESKPEAGIKVESSESAASKPEARVKVEKEIKQTPKPKELVADWDYTQKKANMRVRGALIWTDDVRPNTPNDLHSGVTAIFKDQSLTARVAGIWWEVVLVGRTPAAVAASGTPAGKVFRQPGVKALCC